MIRVGHLCVRRAISDIPSSSTMSVLALFRLAAKTGPFIPRDAAEAIGWNRDVNFLGIGKIESGHDLDELLECVPLPQAKIAVA